MCVRIAAIVVYALPRRGTGACQGHRPKCQAQVRFTEHISLQSMQSIGGCGNIVGLATLRF